MVDNDSTKNPRDHAEIDLTGTSVLITRPAHQSAATLQAIAETGAEAFAAPALEIAAIEFDPRHALRQNLWLFTSANAVTHFFAQLDSGASPHPQTECIAIGEATRRALAPWTQQFALPEARAPQPAGGSEQLLAWLPQHCDLITADIAVIGGVNSRPLLAQTLSKNAASLIQVEVYRRQPPANPELATIRAFCNQPMRQVLAPSSDALRFLLEISAEQLPAAHATLLRSGLVVNSARAERLARSDWRGPIAVASPPTLEGQLMAMAQLAQRVNQR